MKPAPFRYVAPGSVTEVLELLASEVEAKVLAGGQSLVPMMNLRVARPDLVVSLRLLRDLAYVHPEDGGLRIGALTTHAQVQEAQLVRRLYPLMAEAAPYIGSPAIRQRGTLGGSLAHGDPAAEWPSVMMALDARIHVASVRGQRTLAADEFWLGPMTTALASDELIVAVSLPPLTQHTGSAFAEFSRRLGDYALGLAATILTLDARGAVSSARLVLGAVGPTPARATHAERALTGRVPEPDVLLEVASIAATEAEPESDLHATAAYRRHLIRHLAQQALTHACRRATLGA